MHLEFDNKKSIQDIINESNNIGFGAKSEFNKSLLIKGDNFFGLSYLLQSELKEKIDLVYIDPPFNTNRSYTVSGNRCNSVSQSREGIIAYEDNLSIDNYLEFMRERLVLIHELLSERGSLYVHIDLKMGHYMKILLDEIFGAENFKNDITRVKSNPKNFDRKAFGNEKDLVLFYVKNQNNNIWNNITTSLTKKEIERRFPKSDHRGSYTTIPLHAPGVTVNGATGRPWRGMSPPEGRHWRTDPDEFDVLDRQGLIEWSSNGNPRIKKYAKDHKGKKAQDIWVYKDPQNPRYPTQKNQLLLEFIVKQSSNEDSIVLDCFAGSGTTLRACESLNRKWIGMDNSEQAIEIIKSNLSASDYDYIDLSK